MESDFAQHLKYYSLDFRRFLRAGSRVKLVYFLLSLPIVIFYILFSILVRLLAPKRLSSYWNYHYDRAILRYSDPRHIRDIALDIRPTLLGLTTLAWPLAFIFMVSRSISSAIETLRGDSKSGDDIQGFKCLRLLQYRDNRIKTKDVDFFYSPSFPLAAALIYLCGIPGAISAWFYFGTGVDELLGFPSHDPAFVFSIFIIQLYITSLSWCFSTLLFRSYLTYAYNYCSREFEIEIYPDLIKVLPIKGWFRDFAFMRTEHMTQEICWRDVTSITYHQKKPRLSLYGALPALAKPVSFASRLLESLSDLSRADTDLVEIVTPKRTVTVRVCDLTGRERAELFLCMLKYAPWISLSAELQMGLIGTGVLNEPRYTQIWFDALTANRDEIRLEPGASVRNGSYIVDKRLDGGGQAAIYEAIDHEGHRVVLKEYQLTSCESLGVMIESAKAFENETSVLGHLKCDQIVSMKDMFYQQNRVYLVLEHIEGPSLRQLVAATGPLEEAQTVSLALQMSLILQYLHAQDPPVVHRDFTPDNLILQPDGKLKLVDFSVAQHGRNLKRGVCAGKFAYTPPEQFRGEPCPQSDIYALGATLFFLLVGRDPEPISTIVLQDIRPGTSEQLSKVIECATNLSLDERYESAQWLHSELKAYRFA